MNAIEQVVAPLKQAAVDIAVKRATDRVFGLIERIKAEGFDISSFRKMGNMTKQGYAELQLVRRITRTNNELAEANGFRKGSHGASTYVEVDHDGIEAVYRDVIDMAKAQFEEYVRKLTQKVGSYDTAEIEAINGVWGNSILTVTKDGVKTKWKTQIIVNFSKYGLPFNQFPTRIVK